MDKQFVRGLESLINALRNYDAKLRKQHAESSKEEQAKIVVKVKDVDKRYYEARADYTKYIAKETTEEERIAIEKKYAEKYEIKSGRVEELPKELENNETEEQDEEEEEVTEIKKPKNGLLKKVLSYVGIAALAGGIVYGATRCSKSNSADVLVTDEQIEDTDLDEELEPGEPGTFKDASNDEEVNARIDWYFNNYFDKEYTDMNQIQKDSINKENLADIIKVVNGEIPEGFEMNELVNYNNKLTQMFSTYLSTLERTEAGNVGFIPSQYLYEDGSHEQKCAAELDAVMEPLIKAVNEHDNEEFKKYAVEFGELMRDQYYIPDAQANHYNVRSIASFPSRMHLYGLSYAMYAETIMEYGIVNNIDVCIPFCFNSDGVVEEIPLSKLMATLDFVPMGQWEYVLKRAGMSQQEIVNYGNTLVEDTMFQGFLKDAKNHYNEKLSQQMTLTKNS